MLTNFSSAKHKRKKSKNRSKDSRRSPSRQSHYSDSSSESGDDWRTSRNRSKSKSKCKKRASPLHSVEGDDCCSKEDMHQRGSRRGRLDKNKNKKDCSHSSISGDWERLRYRVKSPASPAQSIREKYSAWDDDKCWRRLNREESMHKTKGKGKDWSFSSSSEDSEGGRPHQKSKRKYVHTIEHHDSDKLRKNGEPRASYKGGLPESERKSTRKHKTQRSCSTIQDDSELSSDNSGLKKRRHKGKHKHSYASENFDLDDRSSRRHRQRHGSS